MTIVEVSADANLETMASQHAACFAQPWSADALRALLKTPGTAAFAVSEGFVIARVAADQAEILTLAVMPPSRRLGVGSSLILKAAHEAWARGARAMFLEVDATNSAAVGLYRRFGFCAVGRRPSYYGPSADALTLRADLPLVPLGNPQASTKV